jgi:murein L,D-transpeptidase YafK
MPARPSCLVSSCTLTLALFLVTPAQGRSAKPRKPGRYLTAPRVKKARARTESMVRALVTKRGLPFPPRRIYLRAFKKERQLEVWGQGQPGKPYVLIKTYPICAAAGKLGPKRYAGDHQVPEGYYRAIALSYWTQFHLGLSVNYPNASDRILGRKNFYGGKIMIHGDCASLGCLAMTDRGIEEIYLLSAHTYHSHRRTPTIHIFPTRLDSRGLSAVVKQHPKRRKLHRFWRDLQQGYRYFEKHKLPPRIWVDRAGRYHVRHFRPH